MLTMLLSYDVHTFCKTCHIFGSKRCQVSVPKMLDVDVCLALAL